MLALVVDFLAHPRVAHPGAKCYKVSTPRHKAEGSRSGERDSRSGELPLPRRGLDNLK
ncbi:hypothetical protein DEO72_LG2g3765 [Vigna unguiculata]|uniref:Uncharacterized protein n=1 Tax=Vigna unguiculata TaxID=3917 RepID=A0A4D6L4I2_VIGUN|nr:hypothetical protein DEO72_LG2g3765 [Vigna unguiculata]